MLPEADGHDLDGEEHAGALGVHQPGGGLPQPARGAGDDGDLDEVLAEHPHALIGSVPEICDQLEQRRGELGVSYINVAQRSMEAFAPVVARLTGR
jgi:hypothetical protein